jgi:uncharacterized membrane protein YbaN (DUF454 family)
MMKQTLNYLLMALGFLFLAIGIIGIILPVMPGIPFLIISAYFFSKSSPRLHHWLRTRPHVGPIIQEWERHHVIRIHVKIFASFMLISMAAYPMVFDGLAPVWKILMCIVAIGGMSFIWTRPSRTI